MLYYPWGKDVHNNSEFSCMECLFTWSFTSSARPVAICSRVWDIMLLCTQIFQTGLSGVFFRLVLRKRIYTLNLEKLNIQQLK